MKQSSGILTDVFERITDAFVALDNNWCYTYMNKKAGEIFNRDPAKMIGKHIWTEFPEGIDQSFYKAYYRAMSTQQYIHVEEYYPPYDKWFENHIYPSPEELSIFFRDITERNKDDQALKEKENFIESIINASPDIIYIYDIEETKNVYVNRGIQLNLGYTDEEIKLMGDSLLPNLMPKEDFETYLKDIYPRYATLKDKEILTHEFQMRDKDGNLHWLYARESIFLRKPDGTPKQIFGVTTDITERKKGEENLQEAHQRLSHHLLNTPLAVIEWDKSLIVKNWSPQAEHIFGWKETEVVNKHFNEFNLVFEEDTGATGIIAEELMTGVVDQNRSINRNNTKSGKVIYCQWFNSVFKDEHGNVQSILSLVQNITEQKNTEEEIRKTEEVYRDLVDHITDLICTHDLDGRILSMNKASENAIGQKLDQLKNFNLKDILTSGTKNKYDDYIADILKNGYARGVMKVKNSYGEIRTWEFNNSLKTTGVNSPPVIRGHARDITEQKKAEKLLNESNYSLSEAQRIAKIGIWTYYIDGELKWSDNMYQLYNLPSKITATTPEFFFELVHADDREKMHKWREAILAGESPGEYEFRSILPDSSIHYYSGSGEVKYDKENKPVYMHGTVQDITERKKAELAIIESEEKYRSLIEQASDGIIQMNYQGEIMLVNTALSRMLGYTTEDFLKLNIKDTYLKTERPLAGQRLDQVKEKGSVSFERIMIKKDGTTLPVEVSIGKVGAGEVLGIVRDITERKKNQEALAESENYLRTILQTEPECVKILGLKGELLSMNPAGLAMIEADHEEQALGHQMTELVNTKYRAAFNRLTKEVFKGNSGTLEFEITGLKGGQRWLETHAVPLKDAESKIISLLGITRDITERKKAEEAISQLNQELEIRVKERTAELEKINTELEEINDLFVGREARIIELKEELEELKNKPRL